MDNWAMGMDPELGKFKAGSGIIIPDPQHCLFFMSYLDSCSAWQWTQPVAAVDLVLTLNNVNKL